MEPDFAGYATKAGLKCSDGRTITPQAFQHMDGMRVPLVWQHGHSDPNNILGHGVLEARPDGVYVRGFFNDTNSGVTTKKMVLHGDIDSLSIYANALVEKTKQVLHGMIREVSLVISGANPKAKIDYVRIAHGDGEIVELEDEAIIMHFQKLDIGEYAKKTEPVIEVTPETPETPEKVVEHADGGGEETVQDVLETMSEKQKNVLYYMVGNALETKAVEHSDNNEGALAHKEGQEDVKTTRNVFEVNDSGEKVIKHSMSVEDMKGILQHARQPGETMKTAVEAYALKHGIENLDVLFPDAKTLQDRPEFINKQVEWVAGVINGVSHSPFSRVKTVLADISQEAARALGYIKGNYKKQEWFSLQRRTTTPTTVYKKQQLDRDDIIDVTDFDIVAWMKGEMRMKLEEEIARAILIGDGRDPESDDKIKDPGAATDGAGIRAIANENELFATTIYVNLADASSSYTELIERLLRSRKYYKGRGTPTLYTTNAVLVELLLLKDTTGRRMYNSKAELLAALMVKDIVEVEVMEEETDLVGIIVNLSDYNIGMDRGGEVNYFDDFDIDYNQYKYLMETRLSGALTKWKSAIIIRSVASTDVLVTNITAPTFVEATGVVTIPTKTGVVYKNPAGTTLSAGAQSAIAAGATTYVHAVPASGYYFDDNANDDFGPFTRDEA